MDEEALDEGADWEALAEDFLERHRRGERPQVSEYAERYPRLAHEIRANFPVMLLMEQMGAEVDTDPGAGSTGRDRPSDANLEHPDRIGEYRILREVGRGGMGIVYEASQETLDRRVALKVLPRFASSDQRERFRREAQAAARLSHPNIVPIFAVGDGTNAMYYAMQFIHGLPLDKVVADLRKRGRDRDALSDTSRLLLAEDDSSQAPYYRNVVRLGARVANALAYAHGEGILHRDVKPSNLLLDPKGGVWLTDLGLAKTEDSESLTGSGDIVGTLAYMSPERLDGWADPRSDVYGLGLTLYELLTLRRAFDASESQLLLRMITEVEPVPPRRIDPRIPRDLETIVLKAIDKEPGRRYATAAQLETDLLRFLEGRPILARRSRAPERAWLWCRRNPSLAGLSLLVLALLSTVATVTSLAAKSANETASVLRRRLYASNTRLAREALERGDLAQVRSLLEESPPALRGWEWDRLQWETRFAGETLRGHEDQVYAVAVSPDGTLYASGGNDERLRLWDAATGALLASVQAHGGPFGVQAVAFHPTGEWIATCGSDNAVKLWRVQPLELARSFTGHTSFVSSLAFEPEGTRLCSGGFDFTLRVWDLESGEELLIRRAHKDLVTAVDFHPTGRTILTAGHDGTVSLWNAFDLEPLRSYVGGGQHLQSVDFAPDGDRFVSGDLSGQVRVWDTSTGEVLSEATHRDGVMDVAFQGDGRHVASAGLDGVVKLWNATTGERTHRFAGHEGAVRCVAFGPEGKVVSSGQDGLLKVWRSGSERSCLTLQGLLDSDMLAADFGPDGSFVVTGDSRGFVFAWDSATGSILDVLAVEGRPPVGSVAVRSDGRQVAVGCDDGTVLLWTPGEGAEVRELCTQGPTRARGALENVAYDRSGRRVLSGGGDGTLRVWNAERGELEFELEAHPGPIRSVGYSPDGERIVSAGADGEVRVWEAATGGKLLTLTGHKDEVLTASFSPDGRTIVSGGKDATLILWRASDGERLRTLRSHPGWIATAAFHPDGSRIVSGGADGATRVWDPTLGEELFSLRDTGPWVVHAAFSPDGSRLITCQSRAGTDHRRSSSFDRGADPRAVLWETAMAPTPTGPHRRAKDSEDAGDFAAARAHLDRAIASTPERWSLYADRARLRALDEQWTAAAEDYARAIELHPDMVRALPFLPLASQESWACLLLANMHAAAGEPKESVRALESALRLPSGANYYVLDKLEERRAALRPVFASCASVDAEIALATKLEALRAAEAARIPSIQAGFGSEPSAGSEGPSRVVSFDDFDATVGARWSTSRRQLAPNGERSFLGPFRSEAVRLQLLELPPHARVTLSFELFVIQGWEGNGRRTAGARSPRSADVWTLAVEPGPTLVHTTFSNVREGWAEGLPSPQAYPGSHPGDEFRPMTGAAERSTLGYTLYGDRMDAVYELEVTIPHSASSLTFVFSAEGLDPTREASWGLDNVKVEVLGANTPLTEDEADRCWEELADRDPVLAGKAFWRLVGAGAQGARHVSERLAADRGSGERLENTLALFREAASDEEARRIQLYFEARLLMIAGNLQAAARRFEELIAEEPTWPEPRQRWNECRTP